MYRELVLLRSSRNVLNGWFFPFLKMDSITRVRDMAGRLGTMLWSSAERFHFSFYCENFVAWHRTDKILPHFRAQFPWQRCCLVAEIKRIVLFLLSIWGVAIYLIVRIFLWCSDRNFIHELIAQININQVVCRWSRESFDFCLFVVALQPLHFAEHGIINAGSLHEIFQFASIFAGHRDRFDAEFLDIRWQNADPTYERYGQNVAQIRHGQRSMTIGEHYFDAMRIGISQCINWQSMRIPNFLQHQTCVGVRITFALCEMGNSKCICFFGFVPPVLNIP